MVCARTVAYGVVAALCGTLGTPSVAHAQVVQLPAVQNFGYSGGVSVPDQGQAYLGGGGTQRSSRSTRGVGPLATQGAANQAGGGWASVSATVIDLQAMDEAILNQPVAVKASRPANYTTRHAGTQVVNMLTPQLDARRINADPATSARDPNGWQIALGGGGGNTVGPANALLHDDSAVRYFMQRAKQASDAGRISAAQVYYRMAYERLTPAQRTRLHEIQAAANATAQSDKATGGAGAPATASGAAAAVGWTDRTAAGATGAGAEGTDTGAPATSGAGSPAGEMPADGQPNANPFDSPF